MIKKRKLPRHSFLVLITGAVILGVELTASRYMSPMFGSSLYIWGAILSVTLICLSAGYSVGGRLGERLEQPVGRLVFFVVLSASWIGILPFIQGPIALIGLSAGPTFGPLIITTALFALPILLLATATPMVFADNTKGRDPDEVVVTMMGDLFAISTIGSVIGALATAYLLIPWLGLRSTLFILSLVLFLCISPFVFKGHYLKTSTVAVFLVALLQIAYDHDPNEGLNEPFIFMHKESSPYGELSIIRDRHNGSRLLLLDGTSQNWVGGEHFTQSLFEYSEVMMAHLSQYQPKNKKALVLGLGAGIIPKNLNSLGYEVETVEINPNVRNLAIKFFDFDEHSIVHLQDARAFVNEAMEDGRKYGVVIIDVAGGGSQPSHVFSLEAFKTMAAVLEEDGVLLTNQLAVLAENQNDLARYTLASLSAVFPHVRGFDCYPAEPSGSLTNLVTVVSKRPAPDPNYRSGLHETLYNPDISSIRPITDDWNPMERWSVDINRQWHTNLVDWLGYGAVIPI